MRYRVLHISLLLLIAGLLRPGTSAASDYNLTGIWVYSITNSSDSCDSTTDPTPDRSSVAIATQNGSRVTLFAEGATYSGTVVDDTYTLSRSYIEEGGGVTTETIVLTLSSANEGSGELLWMWSSILGGQCQGSADLVISRQTAAPARNATGMWRYVIGDSWSTCSDGPEGPATGLTVIRQNGDTFTYVDELGIHTGRISGEHYFSTVSYYDGTGITTQVVYWRMQSDQVGAGSVTWNWTDGTTECIGGSQLGLTKATETPAYDASGIWDVQSSDGWSYPGGCPAALADGLGHAAISQDESAFRLAGYHGTQTGQISNDLYSAFLSYPKGNGTVTEVVLFGLDDAQNGRGKALRLWTDGTEKCFSGNDLTLTRAADDDTPPDQPALFAPLDGAENVLPTPLLRTFGFQDPDPQDGHLQTEWQIGGTPDFFNMVLHTVSEARLTALRVPRYILEPGTTYYWRVRFYDKSRRASVWSPSRSFRTSGVTDDANGDGIPDLQEAPTADTDGDGTTDATQWFIKSVSSVTGAGAIGISRKDRLTVTDIRSLSSIDPADISSLARPYDMPFGLIAADISVVQPVDGGEITIHLPEAAPAGAGWFVYDSIRGWSDYTPYVTFSTDRRSVTLHLKDWGYGDADGIPNGRILDPGGVGFASFLDGVVVDAVSQEPIQNAIIRIQVGGEEVEATTLANGAYVTPLIPGTFAVSASADGYMLADGKVVVGQGEIVTQNFSLRQLDVDLDGNGETDLADAVYCLRALTGFATPQLDTGKDVDGNGNIGLAEALYILQAVSGF